MVASCRLYLESPLAILIVVDSTDDPNQSFVVASNVVNLIKLILSVNLLSNGTSLQIGISIRIAQINQYTYISLFFN